MFLTLYNFHAVSIKNIVFFAQIDVYSFSISWKILGICLRKQSHYETRIMMKNKIKRNSSFDDVFNDACFFLSKQKHTHKIKLRHSNPLFVTNFKYVIINSRRKRNTEIGELKAVWNKYLRVLSAMTRSCTCAKEHYVTIWENVEESEIKFRYMRFNWLFVALFR